ncbi:chromosome segregation protein SMC [Sphingomonas ginkgonis]|uniref:Chromosome partition protein Smc n=1 Tax=Sphingomonas ginkgonis TaxID=2315330 RepID=A0A3R9YHB3_9SPHN|nr:chromosome segregation protein SMC [Sphingomonas ginkgonis]RST29945.1 chromosome segregation protein SMC [Sphingomonas ginkgonis]
MQIRRLKLSGFKSFVEPAELRIEPGLTGVVGPNGCGKSNLLEAIRWVMGEASPKSLRGGGMEDVIFAGTATRAPRDFAEVSMLVERAPSDNQPGGESEVTRRIERGAGSAYRLDGKDVRAKDVSLLFADAATGAHSPALVSQGRIGAIIAAKPTERRQMLEEAAGISGLHVRRKDAEQKLRATEANLQRLDELLSDQDNRAAALRRQARAAERYRLLSDRIRVAEAQLLFARWREADRLAEAAATETRTTQGEVARLGAKLTEASEAQAAASRLVAERRTAAVSVREEGRNGAHALATARARLDSTVRRIAELEKLQSSIDKETERERTLRADAAAAILALEAERAELDERIAAAEQDAATIAQQLTGLEAAQRDAEAALAAVLAREAAMRAERQVADAALRSAEAQSSRLAADRQRVAAQLAALGSSDALEAQVRESAATAVLAESAIAEAETLIGGAEDRRQQLVDDRDRAEAELGSARALLSALQSEQRALQQALAKGSAKGVLAAIRVRPGFERALAAALGDDLDAPVAAAGPRYWGGADPAGDPASGAERTTLASLVSAPPELARRLAQVIVADEDDGAPLGLGQRLVTRGGRMRRWDGLVVEGAGAAAADRLIRANRLAELDHAIPAHEERLAALSAAREQAAAALDALRREAEAARTALTTAQRQLREAERARDQAHAGLERLAAQQSALEDRLADLEPVETAARDSLAAARQALAALPDPALLSGDVAAARDSARLAGTAVADKRAEAATRARLVAADRERSATTLREEGAWRARSSDADKRLLETEARRVAVGEEHDSLLDEPDRLRTTVRSLEQQASATEALIAAAASAEREAEEALAGLGRAMSDANEALASARERRAGADARCEAQVARRQEFARNCGERFECPPPLLPERLGFDPAALGDGETLARQWEQLTAERERLGPVNLVAEQELAELDSSRQQGAAERDELSQAVSRLRGSIGSLNREGRVRLLEAFGTVDQHFRSLFTTLFNGGQAHLELVESDDPLEAGLEIMAQPPGKRLSTLTLLSGGEQALTAVALIFALFLTNPAPICVLDEVDAPLDDANVERFCDLLQRMTRETQTRYLIVTHNAVTMSRMHRLYGVTMIEKGVSRLVSVDLGGAETLLAAE